MNRDFTDQIACQDEATFTVTLSVTPLDGTSSWVLEESLPAGTTVSDIDPANSGSYNEDQHSVKWVSLSGGAATHTYDVTIPAGTETGSQFTLTGDYRFHPGMDERAAVLGTASVECTPPCPEGPSGTFHLFDADENGRLNDDELFTLIDAWRVSDGGELDNLLFAGIDAWKLWPSSYC